MVTFDHIPLILSCSQVGRTQTINRIEKFWLRYDHFNTVTKEVFQFTPPFSEESDPIMEMENRLYNLYSQLKLWHKCAFANSNCYLQNCKSITGLFDVLEERRTLTALERFIRVKTKERAYELATNEETKWYQRARCRWISLGDKNTKYFHALVSTRRTTKAITKIIHHGQEVTAQPNIIQAFLSHFRELLGSTQQTQLLDIHALYDQPMDLQILDAPFHASEVHRAVKELADNKASGPDGLPNEFAKQQWEHLKPHVMQIFNKLFRQQADLARINRANIVLIPKHDAPILVTDFRPINVINLIPKLISKVIANRIRPFMGQLVDEHQTAFIQGCLIAENFLVTREVLQHVHRSGSPAVLIKLDFAKAYDTLDWSFLLQVLQARGFPPKMIQWISHILSTATSTIRVNGETSTPFTHKRRLRQGDPLSPYLFVLAADVLQRMTKNASTALPDRLTLKVSYPILNFQYADDTIFIASTKGQIL